MEFAGPVWSLDYLGNGKCIIIGKVSYNIADTGIKEGIEYLNIVDMKDGITTRQLTQIGIGFVDAEVLGPENILVVDKYIGIIKWSNQDMPFYEWRLIVEPPDYLVVGYDGTALAVAKDGITLSLVDVSKGNILKRIVSSDRVVGRPLVDGARFLVPVDWGIIVLDKELDIIGKYRIEGLKGSITLRRADDSIYVVGESNVTVIALNNSH